MAFLIIVLTLYRQNIWQSLTRLDIITSIPSLCFPEDDNMHQKPRSRYQALLSRTQSQKELQAFMPRWVRNLQRPGPLIRSDFVHSIYKMISELKVSAIKDHNVTIASTSITRPSRAFRMEWLFEEAALLANTKPSNSPVAGKNTPHLPTTQSSFSITDNNTSNPIASPGTSLEKSGRKELHLTSWSRHKLNLDQTWSLDDFAL